MTADRLLGDQPDLLARARAIRDSGEFRKVAENQPRFSAGEERFTDRNLDFLIGIAAGDTNEEIASDLCVTVETVKATVKRILRILEARNRAHAVTRGFELGLLTIVSDENAPSDSTQTRDGAHLR